AHLQFYLARLVGRRVQTHLARIRWNGAIAWSPGLMYRDRKIALVAIAHNEERLIVPTLEKVPECVDKVFVVDDASTDQTAELVRERTKADSRVELLAHKTNRGCGAAIITGYLAARAGAYDVTVVVGGDDQMPMEQMTRLLDPIIDGTADYAKGN